MVTLFKPSSTSDKLQNEIKRLNKNLNSTLPVLNKLEKTMAAPGYLDGASETLQKENQEKLESLQKKKADIEKTPRNKKAYEIF